MDALLKSIYQRDILLPIHSEASVADHIQVATQAKKVRFGSQ
jgi:hypothetical protein